MSRQQEEGRMYLLLGPNNRPLGRGKELPLPGGGSGREIQIQVLDGDEDEVAAQETIELMDMGSDPEPPAQCRVIRSRGERVVLEKLRTLDGDLRRNLRVAVEFDTFLYPIDGRWTGRRTARSFDISCGGIAFQSDPGLEVGDRLEVVVPITDGPLILTFQLLRMHELPEGKMFYAGKFVGMCEDEETLLREAVFSVQLRKR